MASPQEIRGIVVPGRGLGRARMAAPGAIERLRELIGLRVVPGTLNVRLAEPFDRSLVSRYVAAADIAPAWEAETGQAGYFLADVLVAGRYRAVAIQGDEAGYPDDQVELLGEARFRNALGLSDGDPISFSVVNASVDDVDAEPVAHLLEHRGPHRHAHLAEVGLAQQ